MTTKVLFDVRIDNGKRGLGDILISTPVVRRLKQKYGYLDYLVRREAHCLLEGNPYINHVLSEANPQDYDLRLTLGHRLEDYSIKRNRQPRVDAMSGLFGVLPRDKKPEIFIPPKEILTLSKDKIHVGVNIESTARNRTWSKEYLQELIEITDCQYHLFGLEGLSLDLLDHADLSLRDTILGVAQMDLFFTVDSFYSHLAVALDIPPVVIYTSVDSDWRARYYDKCYPIQSPIECSPCQDHQEYNCPDYNNPPCIKAVAPEMVKDKMDKILRRL